MISTNAPRRVVKLVVKAPQDGVITAGSTSPQHYDQIPRCSTATDEPAGMTELSKKRKADCFAGDTAEPEAKKGKTLYETTIAAPFRRARRSLVCMHKVFQPIWSRATAQDSAAAPQESTDPLDAATPPSQDPLAVEAAAAVAQTPQKGHLLRAASPLLEEMLDSPVTASKRGPDIPSGSPGRHALYQDAPFSSSSSHQQGLPFPLPCALSIDGNNATSTGGLAVWGSAANSDRCREDVPQTLHKDAAPGCSMSSIATVPTAVSAAIGADTCFSLSPAARLQQHAAEVSSIRGSQGNASVDVGCDVTDVAVTGVSTGCCSDTGTCIPVAGVSLSGSPSSAQAVTGADAAVDPSRSCLAAVGQGTDEQQVPGPQQQPGSDSGSGLQASSVSVVSHIEPVTGALPFPTPSSRRVSFSLPEGANCKDTDRTSGKGFMRSPRRLSPNRPSPFRYSPGKAGTPRFRSDLSHGYVSQPHAWSPLGRHMQGAPHQYRPTPIKCCSSFGSEQAKRPGSSGEQHRGSAAGGDAGCNGRVVDESEEGCGSVAGQEVGAGYVDIPRRVAWERLSSGRRNQALQAPSQQIDPLQQDCREAFLNEKLAFSWKAGQAWAQLDLAGVHFTQDTCSQHHTDWKAVAERFIEKRGYVAAEQLRTTLQTEWQQLKAIRKRCYTSLSEVSDGAGLSTLLPRTPKSIMKRKSPFRPSSDTGEGILRSGLCT